MQTLIQRKDLGVKVKMVGEIFTSDKNVLRFDTQLPKKSKIRFTIHYDGTLLAADGLGEHEERPESSDEEQEDDNTVYTLDGIRLFTPVDEFSEGIYIIGGKKVIIDRSK